MDVHTSSMPAACGVDGAGLVLIGGHGTRSGTEAVVLL
jgi:hypothetical protein